MKFFRKPIVAALLCAAFVIGSTLLSVNIKLSKECDTVIDGFHDGVYVDGQLRPSIAAQLKTIRLSAEEIAACAEKHEINAEALRWACDDLRLGLLYSADEASYLYYCYDELLDELRAVTNELDKLQPGSEDMAAAAQQLENIRAAQQLIDSSGYNESVREFFREELNSFSEYLGEAAGVDFPEQFS